MSLWPRRRSARHQGHRPVERAQTVQLHGLHLPKCVQYMTWSDTIPVVALCPGVPTVDAPSWTGYSDQTYRDLHSLSKGPRYGAASSGGSRYLQPLPVCMFRSREAMYIYARILPCTPSMIFSGSYVEFHSDVSRPPGMDQGNTIKKYPGYVA